MRGRRGAAAPASLPARRHAARRRRPAQKRGPRGTQSPPVPTSVAAVGGARLCRAGHRSPGVDRFFVLPCALGAPASREVATTWMADGPRDWRGNSGLGDTNFNHTAGRYGRTRGRHCHPGLSKLTRFHAPAPAVTSTDCASCHASSSLTVRGPAGAHEPDHEPHSCPSRLYARRCPAGSVEGGGSDGAPCAT